MVDHRLTSFPFSAHRSNITHPAKLGSIDTILDILVPAFPYMRQWGTKQNQEEALDSAPPSSALSHGLDLRRIQTLIA